MGKHHLAGSEFKVVLRRSHKTERQFVLEILIFISLKCGKIWSFPILTIPTLLKNSNQKFVNFTIEVRF